MIKPVNEYLLIKEDGLDEPEKTKSGIYITSDTKKEMKGCATGVIKQVCPTLSPMVKPGARCVFGKYAGSRYNSNGEEYVFIKLSDVLAFIDERES